MILGVAQNFREGETAVLYDLHIHSCLSPCGDEDMTPNNIVGMAHISGLGVIAVTDHNAAGNLPAVKVCADKFGIKLVPGIEVCTNEDIHILCYFKTVDICLDFEKVIFDSIPNINNKPEIYGNQHIMDKDDNITASVDKLLINGCGYSAAQVVDICHKFNGVAVCAHIDKNSFSVLSVLGVLPPEIEADGVEIYDLNNREQLISDGFIKENMPYMSNSDAHYLEYIGEKEQELAADNPLYKLIEEICKG